MGLEGTDEEEGKAIEVFESLEGEGGERGEGWRVGDVEGGEAEFAGSLKRREERRFDGIWGGEFWFGGVEGELEVVVDVVAGVGEWGSGCLRGDGGRW